jgi:hypothetical protein
MTYSEEITAGEQGAARQSWRKKSIRDLLVEIPRQQPEGRQARAVADVHRATARG